MSPVRFGVIGYGAWGSQHARAIASTRAITYADGAPFDRAGDAKAARLADELAFDLPWRHADVALVDNFVAMHGLWIFTGTRKVLGSLISIAP